MRVEERRLTAWRDIVEVADFLTTQTWVFRGHEHADWALQTSLEREFGPEAADVEQRILWHFVRRASQFLPSHLIPNDSDAAAWLGLIRHYGGPTRFLDVTRSPYIALFFAFEAAGGSDRAVWAINYAWCMESCAHIMMALEKQTFDDMFGRVTGAQAQLVYSLVHRRPFRDRLFESFVPFTGVFPVDPWKPDARQAAQQAMFLCAANPTVGFVENLAANPEPPARTCYRFVLPGSLREEVIDRLANMNVTAATLFPDLVGLARSLRTHTVRRSVLVDPPPWERAV